MPDNKRELITQNIVASIATGTSLAKVARKKVLLADWDTIPETQLPYASVMSGLPNPQEIRFTTRQQGKIKDIRSELLTTITVFGRDNVTPDETMSALLQELWIAIFRDYRRGNHALQTTIRPEIETDVFDPYYAFEIVVATEYLHDDTHI